MHIAIVFVLFESIWAISQADAKESVDGFDKLVAALFEKARGVWALNGRTVENTTLGKSVRKPNLLRPIAFLQLTNCFSKWHFLSILRGTPRPTPSISKAAFFSKCIHRIKSLARIPRSGATSSSNFSDTKLFNPPSEAVLWSASFAEQPDCALQVVQEGSRRMLRLIASDPRQSQMWSNIGCSPIDPAKPLTCHHQVCRPSEDVNELIGFENYRKIISVGPSVLGSRMHRVALVGVGGGNMVHLLHRVYPHLHIDAVEYSETVAQLAKSCFAFPAAENVRLHIAEGLSFLAQQRDASYDWIIIDASGSQERFASPEAHAQFVRLMKPMGLLTYNAAGFDEDRNAVEQGFVIAKSFWEYAYLQPITKKFRKSVFRGCASLTFSHSAIGRTVAKQQLAGVSGTLEQEALAEWFGEGLVDIPDWARLELHLQ